MALEETDLTEEDLAAVRDNSLAHNYEPHDVGRRFLVARLQAAGFDVIDHGDDARHADEVFMGDGPDLLVTQDEKSDTRSASDGPLDSQEPVGEELAYVEIKTKRVDNAEWFGRCNRRHYNEYVNFANEQSLPVFVWFAVVDEATATIVREGFIECGTDAIEGSVVDVSGKQLVVEDEAVEPLDSGLYIVDTDGLVDVRHADTVVDGIPAVKGNDVVCLNEDMMRSWMWFRRHLDAS